MSLQHPPRVVYFMQMHRKIIKYTRTSFSKSGFSYQYEKGQFYQWDSPLQVVNSRGVIVKPQSCNMEHGNQSKGPLGNEPSNWQCQSVGRPWQSLQAHCSFPHSSKSKTRLSEVSQLSQSIFPLILQLNTYASPKICFNSLKEPLITLDPIYVQRT